jgi:hypothetical protein
MPAVRKPQPATSAERAPPVTPEYYDTRNAAAYLGLSVQYLEIGRCKGWGPPYVALGRAIRYSKTALDDWMSKHTHRPEVVS